MSVKMNMNDFVWVKLRPLGLQILKWNHDRIGRSPFVPPKAILGWTKFQLWELAHEFGDHLHNGFDQPFETEISLTDPML